MAIVPGLEIGFGLLLIIITWIGAFGISFAFLFFEKIRKLAIPITLTISIIITGLLLLPLAFEKEKSISLGEEDHFYVVRIVFFILLTLSSFVSIVLLAHSILFEPRYATKYTRIIW
ncbi:hypothetical protein LOD99_6828 [Oopsacas minuta]|uniref:Uncharacterized protein n=1 Tax=Oopsacas minuta TaxID=111878 RepID=A0AAV7JJY1_9METZ|nr:hypothetical protein LOD99_6828 [Oopsacas minuta]